MNYSKTIIGPAFFVLLLLPFTAQQAFPAPAVSVTPSISTPAEAPVPPVFPAIKEYQIAERRQDIRTEKATLEKLKAEVLSEKHDRDKKLARLQSETISEIFLDQARLARESARVEQQSIQFDLNNAEQQEQAVQALLTKLQHRLSTLTGSPDEKLAAVRQQIYMAKSLLSLDRNYVELLTTHLGLIREKVHLAESWSQSVEAVYQQQQQIRHQESLDDMKRRLQQEKEKTQTQAARLRQELATLKNNDSATAEKRQLLNTELEFLNESLTLLKTKVTIQTMRNAYEGMDLTQPDALPINTLKGDIKTLQQIAEQFNPLITLTSGRLKVFQQQWALLQKQYALKNVSKNLFLKEKKILTTLIDQFTSLLTAMKSFNTEIQQSMTRVEDVYTKTIQQSLTAHQPLPQDLATWKNLLVECSSLPDRLGKIMEKSVREMHSGWLLATAGKKLIFAVCTLSLCILTLTLARCTKDKCKPITEDLNLSTKFKLIAFSLFRSSRPAIILGGTLLLAGWTFQVDSTIFRLYVLFVIILIVLQLTVKLSYLLFASPLVPATRRQPRLHQMVVWGAIFSAIFTLLVGLGDIGIFSDQLRALVDRLFMFLLLLVVLFFLRLRTLLISSLPAEKQQNFWVRMMALASFSIPLTALSAAVVGLAGYVNLAWFVAGQLALFLVVVIAWLVVRDFIRELLDNRKLKAGIKTEKHALQSSLFLASLKRVLDLLLFLIALWCLAWLYGWGTGTAVSEFLKTWLSHPLFHFGQQEISFINFLTSLFLFALFFYLSSMARQITYAWLYKNIKDRGLRNSLSIFTQYAVLVIGALVALNYMGINLTSLTVFAGALGVGIGFGLQNIANNLISGLILLAERPVRVEDWVSIGDNQGIISRMGLRALVLTTWDNQNVIVPNAHLISNPVTNWTLSDNLIRTVFQVGIRYQDDPHKAREVILDAVSMVPQVSLERKPAIYLTEFADSSVNFRIDFFSELENQHNRLEVKSTVMFAIWDALKDADIGIPFPQRDIYIKEMPMGKNRTSPPIQQEREQENSRHLSAQDAPTDR